MGGQTLDFVFLCFCKRKNIKGVAYTLLNQQMNHLLIIIYYRHAHLFSQKRKNTKMQRSECRTPSWLGGYAERRSISMIEHQNAKYEHRGKFT